MKKKTPHLKIFGYSDDIIEVYGSNNVSEICCCNKGNLIEFTDGTIIDVSYGKTEKAIWKITVVKKGIAPHTLSICDNENAEIYSDIFYINAEVKNIKKEN